MDVDAGSIITGRRTIVEAGMEILSRICATASGESTKAEELGHSEFHI